MITLPQTAKQWLTGIVGAIVGGAAVAGQAWMATSAAHGLGVDVPILNFKALGLIMLSGATASLLAFLAKSPIPVSTTTVTTTLTATKETAES